MTSTKTELLHCNSCRQKTKHRIAASHRVSGDGEIHESVGDVWWDNTFEILECCGCETVKFRQTERFSENDGPIVTYYPPDVSRSPHEWIGELPKDMRALMKEIYNALHAENRRLAAMGARTVLDLVIVDKVGDQGNFARGIESLETQGYLSKVNRKHVTAALEAGHAAIHRGHAPTIAELNDLMDIIENLVHAVYVLDQAAENLKKNTPRRRSKQKPQVTLT